MDELPHLAQLVLLDRHQAYPVRYHLDVVKRGILHRSPQVGQTMSTEEALSLKPLSKLLERLKKLEARDELPLTRKAKPHKLKLPYDEMVTVRLYYGRILSQCCTYDEHCQVRTALAKFHQPSLNIETHIRLVPPTGPGCQTTLL